VREGGLVALEARNQFFALFTLNRYSYEFFARELIRADDFLAEAGDRRDEAETLLDDLRGHFRMDVPPVRTGKDGEPGYDEVISRTHNPFVLRRKFERAGFEDVRVLFYHYHGLPPVVGEKTPDLFIQRSVALEDPDDWRGYFMASAFILAGRRKD